MPQYRLRMVAQEGDLDMGCLRLLRWLERYPFQRAGDLVLALARWERRSSTYRRLALLKDHGFIEAVRLGGKPESIYYLSPLGRDTYARWTGAQNETQAFQDEREKLLRLLPRLPVLLPVQDLVNGLVIGAASALAESGHQAELVQWNWQRDYLYRFLSQGRGEQEMRVRADGALTLQLRFPSVFAQPRDRWYSFLILSCPLDDARLFRQRLDRIMRWRESAERWSIYRQMPVVLILAATPRQAEWWHLAAAHVVYRLRGEEIAGAVAILPTSRMGNSWRLAWRSLGTAIPCHLQDLTEPATAPAFPEWATLSPTTSGEHGQPGYHEMVRGETAPRLNRKRSYGLATAPGARRRTSSDYRLLSLQLVPRQWEILLLCFAHPLLSRDDLAALLRIGHRPVQKLVRALQRMGYLAATETATGPRWHLAETGLRLLARLASCHVYRFVRLPVAEGEPLQQRGVKGLIHQASHTAGVYSFFATLARELAAAPGGRLLWWETGAICERVFVWKEQTYHFKPDAFAGADMGGSILRFWLEWDRGTMGVRDLESKCATCAAYLASREWASHAMLPPVLVYVVPDVAQEQRISKTVKALLAHLSGLKLYITTTGLVALRGVLAPIWLPVLPQTPSHSPPGQRVALFAVGIEQLS